MERMVYVGCALTLAPQAFRDFVSDFKKRLASDYDVDVLEFVGLENGTPQEVYDHDLGNVRKCGIIFAFVEEASIGLGMELSEAIRMEKPILCLHRTGTRITRMLMGAAEKKLMGLIEYRDMDDALGLVSQYISYAEVCLEFPSHAKKQVPPEGVC
jgi:hypothetical protein